MFSDETVYLVREQSLIMEKTGALTPELLNFIYEKGLFKLFVPLQLGGHMISLPEALKIFERASWMDGSFGWLVTIGSGGGFFTASLPPSVSRKLFADRKAVVAGSGSPLGTAAKVDGGFLVNGQWKYCSGANHATLFTANCRIQSNSLSSSSEISSFIFMPNQVEIRRDWNAFGLKATDSHTIVVSNAFVPEDMTFHISKKLDYLDNPIYQYPFLQFAQASFSAVCIGIGKHFLDEAKFIVAHKREIWEQSQPHRYSFVMRKIEQTELIFINMHNHFYHRINDSWEAYLHNKKVSDEEWDSVSKQCQEATRTALYCAQSVFPFLGMLAVMEDSLINQLWRDLHTACQHALLVSMDDEETGEAN